VGQGGRCREGGLEAEAPQVPEPPQSGRWGLIFTHARLSFYTDGSCKAWFDTQRSCVETFSVSSKIPDFTMQKRLQAIDTLLEWSDRLYEQQGEALWATSPAVELAERVHEEAVSRASSYLSGAGEPGSVATSEDVILEMH
jgi:hypothetical protein